MTHLSDALAPTPEMPTSSGPISMQVTALIARARKGDALDIEHTGHAYDVLQSLETDLAPQPDLYADIASKIETFARKSGTSNMYAHLCVTHTQPDLGEYDPSQLFIYDGIRDSGTEFSSVQMRATIFGTVMTSVNITDLADYFRSGNKYQLILHLGSNRQQDADALDAMLTHLPEILAASGMSPAEIAEVIAAIKLGNIPPAALKALHLAAQIAVLKSQPQTPAILAQIQTLSRQYTKLMANAKTLNGLSLVLANALTRLQTPIKALSITPALSLRAIIRAQNDNRPGITQIRNLIAVLRTQRAALKGLAPTQRRAMALALRDLRAGLRGAPNRLQLGISAINATLSIMMQTPALTRSVSALLPVALAATARFSTPALMTAFRSTLAPLIANPQTLPAPIRSSLRAALSVPAIAQGTRQLAAMLTTHPVIAHSIPMQPLVRNILSAPPVSLAQPAALPASTPTTSAPPPSAPNPAPNPAPISPLTPMPTTPSRAQPANPSANNPAPAPVPDCCKPKSIKTLPNGDVTILDDNKNVLIKMTKQEFEEIQKSEKQIADAIAQRMNRDGTARTSKQKQEDAKTIIDFAKSVIDGTFKPKGNGHVHHGDCCNTFNETTKGSNAQGLSESANKKGRHNNTPPREAAPPTPQPSFIQ